ncbi:MAG: AraC family transcriptional regulator [Pseudomonadota bacterium]
MEHTVISTDWIHFDGEVEENREEKTLGSEDVPLIRALRGMTGTHTAEIPGNSFVTLLLQNTCSGHLHANYEGEELTTELVPGNVTVCPPHMRQEYDFEGWVDNTMLLIDTSIFDRIAKIDPNLPTLESVQPLTNVCRPRLARLIEEQNRTFASHESGWKVMAEANNMRIALEILMTFKCGWTGKSTTSNLSEAELALLNSYIEDHLAHNFSLSDLSSVLDRNPLQIARAFKATTGETPYRYILLKRVERAQKLLKGSTKTIAEIAYDCGFASQSHMTTVFSEKAGITPGRYRREIER